MNYRVVFYTLPSEQSPASTIMVSETQGALTNLLSPNEAGGIRKSAVDLSDNLVYSDQNDVWTCCAWANTPGAVTYATGSGIVGPLCGSHEEGNPACNNRPVVKGRHSEGSNYIFADGHASFVQPSRVRDRGVLQNGNSPFDGKTYGPGKAFYNPDVDG